MSSHFHERRAIRQSPWLKAVDHVARAERLRGRIQYADCRKQEQLKHCLLNSSSTSRGAVRSAMSAPNDIRGVEQPWPAKKRRDQRTTDTQKTRRLLVCDVIDNNGHCTQAGQFTRGVSHQRSHVSSSRAGIIGHQSLLIAAGNRVQIMEEASFAIRR
jgi:hypothetical protein